jgi:hypothetical protein
VPASIEAATGAAPLMAAVGVPAPLLVTVTFRVAVAVLPAASFTVAVSVRSPSATVVVFHPKAGFVPV